MRAETLPLGSSAVEKVTVSGWYTPAFDASSNQAWNWSVGEGRRSDRSSAPLVYWVAWPGSWELEVGAKIFLEEVLVGTGVELECSIFEDCGMTGLKMLGVPEFAIDLRS